MNADNISNLSTKRINGANLNTLSNVESIAEIKGKNINLVAMKNFKNEGAQINVEENLEIAAKNIDIISMKQIGTIEMEMEERIIL